MSRELVVAGLLWAVSLWRLPTVRRTRNRHSLRTQRTLAATFAALAASMTFDLPAVKQALVGFTGLAPLLKHLAAVVSAALLLDFVIVVVRPQGLGRRFRQTALVVALVLMLAFYGLANWLPGQDPIPVGGSYSPFAVLYMTIFTLYIGTAMITASWLFLSGARHSSSAWSRAGLGLLGLGTSIGSLYALQRVVFITVNVLTDTRHPDMEDRLSTALKISAIVTITLGSCLPPISVAVKSLRARKALRDLEPLWQGVTEGAPQVVLETPIPSWQAVKRLERRLIEIGDASLALREYVPASLQQRAKQQAAEADVPKGEQDAVAEAAWLAAAVRVASHPPPFIGTEHPVPGGTDKNREEELAWLRQVSNAWTTPLVTKIAERVQPPPLLLGSDDPGMFLHDL